MMFTGLVNHNAPYDVILLISGLVVFLIGVVLFLIGVVTIYDYVVKLKKKVKKC